MITLADKKSVRWIFGKILVIVLLALFFSCVVISGANDIYAFIKKDLSVQLQIDTPVSLARFSKLLEENGIVNNGFLFNLYTRSKDKVELIEGFEGDIYLNSSMSYREILLEISNK